MLISEIPFIQLALPVVVVLLFIILVFTFGFKSPTAGVPTNVDIRDDDDKLQKGKRSNSKKQSKVTETQRMVGNSTNAKQAAGANSIGVKQVSSAASGGTSIKQTAVVKPVNNISNQVKAPAIVTPVEKTQNQSKAKVAMIPVEKAQNQAKAKVVTPVEKVQSQSKPKVVTQAKKQSKVVDENDNIQVGDWTTAVSKKNRKNQVKKKESAMEEIPKSDVFVEMKVNENEEEAVVGNDLQVVEQELPSDKEIVNEDVIREAEELPEEEKVQICPCPSDVPLLLPESLVIRNADLNEEETDVGQLDAKKLSKKMKKKEKKVMKDAFTGGEVDGFSSEASKFVAPELEQQQEQEEEVQNVVEAVVVAIENPLVEDILADKQLVELNVVVEEKTDVAKSSKKKKKSAESRKKFQETPVVKEIGSSNGDEFMVQVLPSAVQSTLQETSSSLPASSKISTDCDVTASTAGGNPSIRANAGDAANILGENSPISEIKNTTLGERDDWKQAKPVKRKRVVQKEH